LIYLANFVEQPLIIVPGVPSVAADWERLRGLWLSKCQIA